MSGEQKPSILIVEDDKFLLKLLETKLQKEGFGVQTAENGVQAIEILKTSRPTLILLDLILPEKNGFEVLAEIKASPETHDIPVLIISNLGQDTDIARGKELGALEYFVKSDISVNDLVKHIRDYFSQPGGSPRITPV
jgi:Response regulators consisting of a CheY-like receiver domain and a winged-helix DNA-binding domain